MSRRGQGPGGASPDASPGLEVKLQELHTLASDHFAEGRFRLVEISSCQV